MRLVSWGKGACRRASVTPRIVVSIVSRARARARDPAHVSVYGVNHTCVPAGRGVVPHRALASAAAAQAALCCNYACAAAAAAANVVLLVRSMGAGMHGTC